MNDVAPITISRSSTLEERQFALMQIYHQILERIPFEDERRKIAKLEKEFLTAKIGVRRFLKELGCSELYLNAFYYTSSNVKFLENCFKHFLGRTVANHEEMHNYINVLTQSGVLHLITEILDSEEYRKAYGCFTVPYARQLDSYESPKAFLESQLINNEHVGQRGWSMPTLYWHELGYVCENGNCHPEAYEVLEPLEPAMAHHRDWQDTLETEITDEAALPINELLALLRTAPPSKAREMVASLSPQQRQVLRQAIH